MTYYDKLDHVKNYIDMCEGTSAEAIIDDLKLYLEKGKTLLEIGMGPGNDLTLLNKYYQGTGSDLSEHFLDLYKKSHPETHLLKLDAVTLNTLKRFDALYSNKALIHLNLEDLKRSVKRQSEILTSKGIICHTFWKGSGQEVNEGLLTRYIQESELLQIFEPCFKLELIKSYEEFEPDDSILLIMSLKA